MGLINLIFVYLVYSLNKKDTNPKITFLSNIEKDVLLNKLIKNHGNLDIDLDTIIGFYGDKSTYIVDHLINMNDNYFMFNKYYNIPGQKNIYNYGYDCINYNQKGFPISKDYVFIWYIDIENKSEYPATNLNIELELTIKKAIWNTCKDSNNIINLKYIDYKKINRVIKIDYFPGFHKKRYNLLKLQGECPIAELRIKSAKSDEISYVKKPIKIDTYIHNNLEISEIDTEELKDFIGYYKPL